MVLDLRGKQSPSKSERAITKDSWTRTKDSMSSSSYFPAEDKLHDKSDYHGWKMSLDLTLEEKEVMDYVQGKIPESPSNALVAAKTKYNKVEVKAKKIIRDSIDKHLMAYISKLKTSKEIYDGLVDMLVMLIKFSFSRIS